MVNQYEARVKQYLRWMYEFTLKLEIYTKGMTYDDFISNSLVVDACIVPISQIGELAAQIKKLHYTAFDTKLPMKSMVAMRNFLIHSYHKIDVQELRNTIAQDIPSLKENLEKILIDMP